MYVAGGNKRQLQPCTELLELDQLCGIVGALQQFHGDPQALREMRGKPVALCFAAVRLIRGQPEHEAVLECVEIGTLQLITALCGASSAERNEFAEFAV